MALTKCDFCCCVSDNGTCTNCGMSTAVVADTWEAITSYAKDLGGVTHNGQGQS